MNRRFRSARMAAKQTEYLESKGELKSVEEEPEVKTEAKFAPLKVPLSLDEIEQIEKKALTQHITARLREAYKDMSLEELIECKQQLTLRNQGNLNARPTLKFQQLLEADLYARQRAPKEKKTSTQHFVTFNPKEGTCPVCFQSDILDLMPKQQAKIKLIYLEWVLEFTKAGNVHAHLIMEFTDPLAVSQVRDRYFKKLSEYFGTKHHIDVKAINNIKGIRDYLNNNLKKEKSDKKEAAERTEELRKEFEIKDLYIMSKDVPYEDLSLPSKYHQDCILAEEED